MSAVPERAEKALSGREEKGERRGELAAVRHSRGSDSNNDGDAA
jgi:hypothetical protein